MRLTWLRSVCGAGDAHRFEAGFEGFEFADHGRPGDESPNPRLAFDGAPYDDYTVTRESGRAAGPR
jgi:hypothetical protein